MLHVVPEVLSVLCPLVCGGLGFFVTTREDVIRKRKVFFEIAFVVLAILGAGAAIFLALDNDSTQAALQRSLASLQKQIDDSQYSRTEVATFGWADPVSARRINIYLHNGGNIASLGYKIRSRAMITSRRLSPAELDAAVTDLLSKSLSDLPGRSLSELGPGAGNYFTIADAVSLEDAAGIAAGTRGVSLLAVTVSIDKNTAPGEFRISEYCGSGTQKLNAISNDNCSSHNRTYLFHVASR
jgi:hypothetical protein